MSGIALTGLAGCTGAGGSSEDDETTTTTSGHHHEDGGHDETTKTTEGSHEESGHGGDSHSHGGGVGEPTEHATVTMKTTDGGYHFDPHVVWVKQGGTVTWELESGTHTATAYSPENDAPLRIPKDADSFASGTMSEHGATFEHTFDTVGVYDYFCVPHESLGMLGSVIVGQPDAHGQPALAEPQSSLPEKTQSKLTDLNKMVNEALGHTH
ncbi:MAG: plastocyanin/azurin family copper-binding protein [Halobacterium sp.]